MTQVGTAVAEGGDAVARTSAAEFGLRLVAGTCLAVTAGLAVPALGFLFFVLVTGSDGWGVLIATLSLGVTVLAVAAAIPHVLVMWWLGRVRQRGPTGGWGTLGVLAGVAAAGALLPVGLGLIVDPGPRIIETLAPISVAVELVLIALVPSRPRIDV